MDDLISRQAAIDALGMAIDVDDFRTATGLIHEATVSKVLDCIPAADVVPVVHGKWIPHSEKSREYIGTVLVHVEYDYWLCDTCGYRVEKGQPMYNFCPNCGAKMDGKSEE